MNRKLLLLGTLALALGCGKSAAVNGSVPDAAHSTLSLSAATAPADGTTALTVTAIVRDANDSPLPGLQVVLSASGSGNTLVQPPPTDAQGQAQGTLASTQAGSKTLSVSAISNGQSVALGTLQATFTALTAPSPSAANSTVTANPTSGLVADGTESSTITVIVKDANGDPLAGQTVSLAAPGAAVVEPAAATDSTGAAVGSISATVAGTVTVTATVGTGADAVVLAEQPTVAFAAPAPVLSATNSTATATPATGVLANGIATSTITVVVKDTSGAPVAGQTVTLQAPGAGVDNPTAPTDVNGVATGGISSTSAGTKTVTVIVGTGTQQITLAQMPAVTFIADDTNLSATNSTVVASPTSGLLANGIASSTITVVLKDANGNPVAGQPVALSAPGALITDPPATDSTGTAVGTVASLVSGTVAVTVTAGAGSSAVTLAQAPVLTFIADVSTLSATTSTATANPTSGVIANGTASAVITVVVKDANGNALSGQTVSLAAPGATVVNPAAATDASGTATGSISSTSAGTKTITVTVGTGNNTVVLAQKPTVSFIGDASTLSASGSTATANPTSGVVANGVASSVITVALKDANGNPVAGLNVSLAAPGATVVNPAAATDAGGTATGSVSSTSAGTKTITVTVGSGAGAVVLTQKPAVTFIGDVSTLSASSSTATANPTSGVVADGTTKSTVTVVIKDANGNPLAGQTVSLAAPGATVFNPSAATDATGTTTGSISSTSAGTKTITVTVGSGAGAVVLTEQPTVAFIGDASNLSASNSTATANPTSGVIANGTASATVTVVIKDIHGNPVAGQTVSLAAPGATVSNPPAATDSTGTAIGSLTATSAGTKTVTVSVGTLTLTEKPTVGFVGDASNLSASNSTVTANPTSEVVANGTATSTLTVVVKDVNGNPVSGQSVSLAAPGATVTQPTATTDSTGTATGKIASTSAGTKTVTATVGTGESALTLAQQPTVSFIGDASNLSASDSTVSANPTSGVVANGTASSTLTVVVKDVNGNPVSGQSVSLAAPGASVTNPSATTDSTGTAVGSIAATTTGTKTVTATVGTGATAVVLAEKPTVTFIGDASNVSASHSTFTVSGSPAIANGVEAVTVSVVIRDVNDNLVAGAPVQLTVTAGAATTVTQPPVTASDGTASGTLTALIGGARTVSIGAGSGTPVVIGSFNTTFLGDPARISASLSTVVASPNSGIAADGVSTASIAVTVKDVNGIAVANAAVALSAPGSSVTVVSPAANTDSNGLATGTVATTVAQTLTVSASATGSGAPVALSQQPTAVFIGDANHLSSSLSTISASPTTVVADGTHQSTITVTARDVNGNPVSGQLISLLTTPQINTFNPSASTDLNGQAVGYIQTISAGTVTVNAQIGLGGSALTLQGHATVTFIGDVSTLSASRSTLAASPSSGLRAGVDSATLTVVARDANDNPVQGVTVALTSSDPQVALVQPAASTDSTGTASGSLSSNFAGAHSVAATVNGIQLSPITVTYMAGQATQLVFTSEPSPSIDAGASFSTAVALEDVYGNVETGSSANIVLSLSSGSLSGTTTVAAASGVATFNGLSIAQGGTYTLSAASSGIAAPGVSTAFTVVPFSIASFTSDRTQVFVGQAANLSWTLAGLPTALSLNPGALNVLGTSTEAVTPWTSSALPSLLDARQGYTLRGTTGAAGDTAQLKSAAAVTAGTSTAQTLSVARLADGGLAALGSFTGTIALGTNQLVATGSGSLYVARYSSAGAVTWAKRVTSSTAVSGATVAALPDGGGLVGGTYTISVVLGPDDAAPITLTAGSGHGHFLARYASDGTVTWAKNILTSTSTSTLNSLSASLDGGAVATGTFAGTQTFGLSDPNATSLTNSTLGGFVVRYSPAGTMDWAVRVNGASTPTGIAALPDGGAYVTGSVSGSVTFGPGETGAVALTAAVGTQDAFLARYNPIGTISWAVIMGATEPTLASGYAVGMLPSGAAVLAGSFNGGFTNGSLSSYADTAFLASWSSTGTFLWAKQHTAPVSALSSTSRINALDVWPDGTIAVAGKLAGTMVVGIGESNAQTVSTSSTSDTDAFVARHNGDGTLSWIKTGGSTATDLGLSVAALDDGSATLAGSIGASAVFGTGDPTPVSLPASATSGFSATYGPINYAMVQLQPTGVAWLKALASTSVDQGYSVSPLPTGGMITAGLFRGTMSLGAGEANATQLSPGNSTQNIYWARYNIDGTLAWAETATTYGGFTNPQLTAAADGSSVLIASANIGTYYTFSPLAQFATINSNNSGYIPVMVRFNSDGSAAWTSTPTGLTNCGANGAYDPGGFAGAAAPYKDGTSAFTLRIQGCLTFGSINAYDGAGTTAPYNDVATIKYSATGTPLWITRIMHTNGNGVYPSGVASYDDGTLVVGGYMSGDTIDFTGGDTFSTTISGGWNSIGYIARYTTSGTINWVRTWQASPTTSSVSSSISGIAPLPDGSMIVAGYVNSGTVLIGTTSVTAPASHSVGVIVRYDAAGDVVWVRQIARPTSGSPDGVGVLAGVSAAADGSFAITGALGGTVVFDASAISVTASGNINEFHSFVAHYDTTGTIQWARVSSGTTTSESGSGVAAFSDGSVAYTGTFGAAPFTLGGGEAYAPSLGYLGSQDAFLGKFFGY